MLKRAEEEEERRSSSDLIDRHGFGGVLADLAYPTDHGGRRAGAAAGMNEAMGRRSPLSIRHPAKAQYGAGILGGLVGSVGGSILASYAARNIGDNHHAGGLSRMTGVHPRTIATAGGALAGGLGVGAVAMVVAALRRRRHIEQTAEAYDEALAKGEIGEKDIGADDYGVVSSAIAPLSDNWRIGRLRARQHALGREADALPYHTAGTFGLGLAGTAASYGSMALNRSSPSAGAAVASLGLPMAGARLLGGWVGHGAVGNKHRKLDQA